VGGQLGKGRDPSSLCSHTHGEGGLASMGGFCPEVGSEHSCSARSDQNKGSGVGR
jgi:hypothetical protein